MSESLDPVWIRFDLPDPSRPGSERVQGFMCKACQFILGGKNVEVPPPGCPMCTVASGGVVAVVPTKDAKPKVLMLDGGFALLIEDYRSARRDARSQRSSAQASAEAGHYDLDGGGFDAQGEAAASREHRAAMALADATLERSPGRPSRPSASPRRPSHAPRGSARRRRDR